MKIGPNHLCACIHSHDSFFVRSLLAAHWALGKPQLSIYGNVNRLAQGLVKRLTGKDVTLA